MEASLLKVDAVHGYSLEILEGEKLLASEGFKVIDSKEQSDADFQSIQR